MDVIAMDKYGIHYAVAPLGTALTEDQIQEAWKVVAEPTCCFDGDSAGVRAAIRSIDRALPILKAGYSLKYAFLPDKQDPDEFLKAHGRDDFLKVIGETVPLKDLLWRKNTEGQPAVTPEQKALIEKNIKEEVAKITDEVVRGYYVQDMKEKIYQELGQGAWRKSRYSAGKNDYQGSFRRREDPVSIPRVSAVSSIKTNLDDLGAQYVISALVCYPELAEEYEERLAGLEIRNPRLKQILDCLLDVVHEEKCGCACAELLGKLASQGLESDIKELLEFKMLKRQNPTVIDMRANLDRRLIEEQLGQLESEIKECLRQIEVSDSFPEEVYNRYQSLKKEREALLAGQEV